MARVALVTGAGSGIGRAASIALADAGFTVVLAGRRQEPIEEAAAAADNGAVAIACDVRDAGMVARLFGEIELQFGRLDLLFNNAGVGARLSLLKSSTSTTGARSSRPTSRGRSSAPNTRSGS